MKSEDIDIEKFFKFPDVEAIEPEFDEEYLKEEEKTLKEYLNSLPPKTIYFYGGAFDPLTNAHMKIIKELATEKNINDELRILVTSHDYKKYTLSLSDRISILNKNFESISMALSPIFNVFIDEQDKRTYDYVSTNFGFNQNKYVLVIGEDEYKDFQNGKWYYPEKIKEHFEFKVIPRTDNISSTKVRELISNGSSYEELKNYISDITYNYLKEKVKNVNKF